ncbi:hypothetical protein [Yimella sp. cx-51]|uniref:hypothetical protein n=1 Tax=Yimella sp. cx-51 TaxID=2770551 RepID=UPI00165D32F4|nr:hypothetical protein [Yimella sp. cx-51]MBC9956821.1 hypothetical protein [Yimella sp. cx-51]QTH39050.1 hypothetical protein J5M86_05340 [Yimella sp. cx-51]
MIAQPYLRLTDEELELLGGAHPLVVQPYLETVDPEARDAVLTTAARSLWAHGVAVSEVGAIQVPEHVVDLLQWRQDAQRVLVVVIGEFTEQEATETAHYVHSLESAHLVETVTPDGMHAFAVHEGDLEQLIDAWIRPLDVVPGSGSARTATRLGQPWGQTRLRLDATLWRPGERAGRLIGALGGAGGTWLTDVEPAEHDAMAPELGDGEVLLEPTDHPGLVTRILTLIAPEQEVMTGHGTMTG